MEELLKKLYYKSQNRIAVIEAPEGFLESMSGILQEVQIDVLIDPRYLYDFLLIFVSTTSDVAEMCPKAIHNLSPDGKLWIAFPKNASKKYSAKITRDKGWEPFEQSGYRRVSQISIDEDWSALRFRNKKYIKSSNKEE